MITFGIIGGDLRQLTLYKKLLQDGFPVKIYGFDNNEYEQSQLDEILSTQCIILPIPVNVGDYVFAPFANKKIPLSDIKPKSDSYILGGKIPENFAENVNISKNRIIDYTLRNDLAEKNAVPTAEGAIEIAMRETPITLYGTDCLVMGYGRIGKVLAKSLSGIGANVSVFARRESALEEIEKLGYKAVSKTDLANCIHDFKIVFNTVPSLILNSEILQNVSKNVLIIDLSSKPGGVDFSYATLHNINIIWALGLPGKVAPISAGVIIYETIMNIVSELGL